MGATGWIALAVLVVLALWGAAVYNRLRLLRNRVENAWAQIDVQLKRRYDLIPNLVEVARGYMQHEAATLQAVTLARNQAVQARDSLHQQVRGAQDLTALAAAEQRLGGCLGQLMLAVEQYPDLQANAQMQSLSEEIASTENRIGFARQAYNDQVLAFNDKAGHFPDVLWARLLGFVHLDMLQSTSNAAERQVPQVRF